VTAPGPAAYNGSMLRAALVALTLATGAAAAAPIEAQQQPLVVYTRTGGFIGVQDSMKVFRDGTVSSTSGDFRISARRLATLRARLVAARFPTLRREYEADYPIADGFVYGVTYSGRRVVVNEEAKTPLRLRRALDLLNEMFVLRR
jgi:hypothetical protein